MSAAKQLVPTPGPNLAALVAEANAIEQQILELAEANDGEINPTLDAFLEGIKTQIGTKADNYKFVIDRLEFCSQMLDAQANRIYQAANAVDSAVDRMKARIKDAMVGMKVDEVKGSTWRFKMSKTKGRLVVQDEKLPKGYLIAKTVYDADKERIRAEIEAGKEVPGAVIEPGFQLRVYVNKAGT